MVKLAFGVEPSNRKFRLRLARYAYLARTLAEFLPEGPSRVLDTGCGKGRVGLYWRHMGPPEKRPSFVGLDLSPNRLGMAQARGYDQILRCDLLQRWPLVDESFDAVVCEQVLEHFGDEDVRYLLSEMRRVLKPGGFALIGTPVFSRFALWLSPIWKRINPIFERMRGRQPAHLQHFLLEELARRIEGQGLLPERKCGFRLFSLPRSCLEDYEWYYRVHRWLGARWPGLCIEANVLARKPRYSAAGS